METVGVIFTIFCVGYATIRAASSGQDLTGVGISQQLFFRVAYFLVHFLLVALI
jgi:hypothetical protein